MIIRIVKINGTKLEISTTGYIYSAESKQDFYVGTLGADFQARKFVAAYSHKTGTFEATFPNSLAQVVSKAFGLNI